MRQYGLVPTGLAPLVGGALIAAELLIGALLVSGFVPVLAAVGRVAVGGREGVLHGVLGLLA